MTPFALCSDFAALRRDLAVLRWMYVANIAMTSVVLGIVLARLFQP